MEGGGLSGAGGTIDGSLERLLPSELRDVWATISVAFANPEAARRSVDETLYELLEHESGRNVEMVRRRVELHCRALGFAPRREYSDRMLEDMRRIRESVTLRATWPRDGCEDPRRGTVLEAAPFYVFEKADDELMRLRFMNPLPVPQFTNSAYGCDACEKDMVVGYQLVTEDETRDAASYHTEREGWDVCTPCSVQHLVTSRQRVVNFVSGLQEGPHQVFERSCAAGSGLSLELNAECMHGTAGHPLFQVSLVGTAGLHAAIGVFPVDGIIALPRGWLRTGRAETVQAPFVPPPSTAPPAKDLVVLKCVSGEETSVAWEDRGRLACSWRQDGEDVRKTFRAMLFRDRDASERGETCEGKLAYISFQGTGRGVWLPPSDRERALEELRALARRSGVGSNLPAPPAAEAPPARPGPATSESASEQPGTAGADLLPRETATEELPKCTICQESVLESTWLKGTPVRTHCGHLFHRNCLRRLAKARNHGVCPNCKAGNLLGGMQTPFFGDLRRVIDSDVTGAPLQLGHRYRVVALLSQDPTAIVDSVLLILGSLQQAAPT